MKKVLQSFLSRVTSLISFVMLTSLPATGGTRRKSRILQDIETNTEGVKLWHHRRAEAAKPQGSPQEACHSVDVRIEDTVMLLLLKKAIQMKLPCPASTSHITKWYCNLYCDSPGNYCFCLPQTVKSSRMYL